MKIDLNNRKFKVQSTNSNGEVSHETIFHYKQSEDVISATYCGGAILKGQLIGKIINDEYLDFRYQHININKEIMTGTCKSYPELMENGKIKLNEYWSWTCKDNSEGESSIIEI